MTRFQIINIGMRFDLRCTCDYVGDDPSQLDQLGLIEQVGNDHVAVAPVTGDLIGREVRLFGKMGRSVGHPGILLW